MLAILVLDASENKFSTGNKPKRMYELLKDPSDTEAIYIAPNMLDTVTKMGANECQSN